MDKCQSCLYCDVYKDVNSDAKLYLCFADIEQENDGIRYVPEVSEFDSSDCVYFKKR